jgi:CubicO group peptidase (beta-lactamase class C family)
MRSTLLKIFVLTLLPTLALGQSPDNKFQPLLNEAKKSNSDAVIVIQNGEKIIDYQNNGTTELLNTMSATKSVVALAVAQLLSENIIDSLDTPVAHFYPEWRQGQKKKITIRHLLNNTSGLQNVPNAAKEIHPSPNILQLALCASVVDKPGTKFSYNNKAVNILTDIIQQETGQKLNKYLRDGLFNEMGITDFKWKSDEAGNLYAMSGLYVHPTDLAKIGQLVLNKGKWQGKQLIAEQWITKLLEQSQPFNRKAGLLWWRIPSGHTHVIDSDNIKKLKQAGLNQDMLTKMENIKGHYNGQNEAVQALMSQFNRQEVTKLRQFSQKNKIRPWRQTKGGNIIGYMAKGYLGQFLVIYPDQQIVAVRMVSPSDNYNQKTDGFGHFSSMVYKLATQ